MRLGEHRYRGRAGVSRMDAAFCRWKLAATIALQDPGCPSQLRDLAQTPEKILHLVLTTWRPSPYAIPAAQPPELRARALDLVDEGDAVARVPNDR